MGISFVRTCYGTFRTKFLFYVFVCEIWHYQDIAEKQDEDEVVVWDKGDEQTLRMLERFKAGGSNFNDLLLTNLREQKENAKKALDVNEDENEEFKVIYIGSRSNEKHHLSVYADMTIGHFKHILYAEFHGMEFDYEGKEADYTNKHNIQMAKSGKVLMDSLTFADYGIKKSNVPFELTLKFTLDAGGKRVSLTD
jgi:co-chaperonin GroES (HSP10)